MIHYQLRCGSDHQFDGWFRDSAAFEGQAEGGLLSCPLCGSAGITRALMAPAVGKGRKPPTQVAEPAKIAAAPAAATPTAAPVAVGAMPDQMRAMLQRMRAEVERRCDYVGGSFATEARKMHDGQTAARAIYGEATADEAQGLADDGIEVAQMPWISRADS